MRSSYRLHTSASEVHPTLSERTRWTKVAFDLLAFVLGVAVSVLLKQALACLAYVPAVLFGMVENLRYCAGSPAPEWGTVGAVIYAAGRLSLQSSAILTYGSRFGAWLLLASGLIAWAAALALVVLGGKRARARGSVVARFIGAVMDLVWIATLPTHAANHP